ncbi:MAG TPA: hypothetical protein VGC76_05475 [Pyrinomonadaceae bacterium]|jgi:hypothetical protein
MKENCFDIGTIQAFLDGELASDTLENVACHLALCDECALQLADAEEETAFAFNALEQEFNTLVPTHRLWTKINNTIERERKSFWTPILAFFRNPAMVTFAAFLIVFGLFVAYLNLANNSSPVIADVPQNKPAAIVPISKPDTINQTNNQNPADAIPENKGFKDTRVAATDRDAKNYRPTNANLNSNRPKTDAENAPNNFATPKAQPAVYQYLPGEESYIKTIATLEKTVDSRKDETLKPSSRIAYEKDLAIVNDAIGKMKAEVKKNPKNESAKQILLASYQSKVDLLNSVAGKTELMASLR